MKFSIRELLLITAVVALVIPYLLKAGQKAFLPQYDFMITQAELVGWIQQADSSAVWRGTSHAGGTFDSNTEFTIEHAPGCYALHDISQGVMAKLDKEGWHLDSNGMSPGGPYFHFRKGPSRWRLFIYEHEPRAFVAPPGRAASTYLIIRVHDSLPDL